MKAKEKKKVDRNGDDEAVELYRRYRPRTFAEVIGQDSAVKVLQGMEESGKIPHVILFSGPSGCGKTTLARILCRALNSTGADFQEVNCADDRGIDVIRNIRTRMTLTPMNGGSRVWIMDEIHKTSSDAQSALLKILEDTPSHVYFMLATTDPNKLLPTIRTRCTEIKLDLLGKKHLEELIGGILTDEGKDLTDPVLKELIEVADGSARRALVYLHQIIDLDDEKDQLEALRKIDVKRQAIDIARHLAKPKPDWKGLATILKSCEEDPEGVRRMILAYFRTMLLNNTGAVAERANGMISCFSINLFDTGAAGLASQCYEACIKE